MMTGFNHAFPAWRPLGRWGGLLLFVIVAAGVSLAGGWLRAQDPDDPNGTGSDLLSSSTTVKPAVSSESNDHLLGTFGGSRVRLADHGLTLNLIYTGEVFGNPLGGRRQGAVYDGLIEVGADVDFAKAFGWQGLTFHVNAYDIHGASGTNKYVGDYGRFSNIDYYDSFRLFELWFEQQLKDDRFSVRFGQLAADKEFFGSDTAALFVNSNFGTPPTISANLPVPVYGSATPGLRMRVRPTASLYFQAAVYDGNPDPDSLGDPSPGFKPGKSYNHNGVKINLNSKEGAFSLYELGYQRNHGKDDKGLPGTYKLGGWYHTDTFSDLESDRRGRSLADPVSDGIPRAISGDWGGYFVADQMVCRPVGGAVPAHPPDAKGGGQEAPAGKDKPAPPESDDRGLTVFLRISGAPGDRNPVSFYTDAGLSYKGLLPTREHDLCGLAFSYTRFSDSVRNLDQRRNLFSRAGTPAQDEEIVIEGSYQVVLKPYWAVQPDVQFIIHPGGSAVYDDALVMGLRSVLTF